MIGLPLRRPSFARAAAVALSVGLAGTASATNCITAGRIDDTGRWAPQLAGIVLLDAQGKALPARGLFTPDQVKSVKVASHAPVSVCQASAAPLPQVELASGATRIPIAHVQPGPSPLIVTALHRPSLRTGGKLVELQIEVPANRLVTR